MNRNFARSSSVSPFGSKHWKAEATHRKMALRILFVLRLLMTRSRDHADASHFRKSSSQWNRYHQKGRLPPPQMQKHGREKRKPRCWWSVFRPPSYVRFYWRQEKSSLTWSSLPQYATPSQRWLPTTGTTRSRSPSRIQTICFILRTSSRLRLQVSSSTSAFRKATAIHTSRPSQGFGLSVTNLWKFGVSSWSLENFANNLRNTLQEGWQCSSHGPRGQVLAKNDNQCFVVGRILGTVGKVDMELKAELNTCEVLGIKQCDVTEALEKATAVVAGLSLG